MRSSLALPAALAGVASLAALLGCEPSAPGHPTWAHVQPILAGQCTGCHGAGAATTGSGYRFDFYDMTEAVCGEAVQGIGADTPMAQALSARIWNAISTPDNRRTSRPLMPPEPAPYLADWEWQTIRGWVADKTPKGEIPPGNRPAQFRLYHGPDSADEALDLTILVEDPDGDPVVGVLNVGDEVLRMDRGGSFSAHLDTAAWPAGDIAITAVLCDGWSSVSYTVGTLKISHPP